MKTRAVIDFAAGRIRERLSTVGDVATAAPAPASASASASASTATRQAKKSVPQRTRRRPR